MQLFYAPSWHVLAGLGVYEGSYVMCELVSFNFDLNELTAATVNYTNTFNVQ